MFRSVRIPALLSLLALSLPATAEAAPVRASPIAKSRVTLVKPLTLQRINDMDFAWLGVTTGGTATIDPISGALSVSGGLIPLGGTPSPARYAGAASKSTVVNIKVPRQAVPITRVGGTETLMVGNFTLDGQDKRTLAQSGSFIFAVGAQITVPAGTIDGLYAGEIDVTIQYP
ncbi:MAG: DUF4402 domain-containing protein [Sphingomicrobium sp.]